MSKIVSKWQGARGKEQGDCQETDIAFIQYKIANIQGKVRSESAMIVANQVWILPLTFFEPTKLALDNLNEGVEVCPLLLAPCFLRRICEPSLSLSQAKSITFAGIMKYLIAGLGNIGDEYAETRHNIGFKVVEELASSLEGTWRNATLGSICEVKHKGRILILLKPNTYMNLSGKAVNYWLQKEKIPVENLLVILDEIQLDLGTIRLRGKGTDGGHNGLKDIQAQLATTEYARLRIGVGKNFQPGGQVNYVLGKWTKEESMLLPEVYKAGAEATKTFVSIGLKRAMDQVNAVTAQVKPEKK